MHAHLCFFTFYCIDLASEKAPGEAASFDKTQLKKVETKENIVLPTPAGNLKLGIIGKLANNTS